MNDDLERAALASTDPRWRDQLLKNDQAKSATVGAGGETAATGCQPAPLPKRDGRHLRSDRSSAALVRATREIMLAGNFRPGMNEICQRAGVALRTGFDHFRTVENLLLWAIESPDMAEVIAAFSPAEIARLVVTGRV